MQTRPSVLTRKIFSFKANKIPGHTVQSKYHKSYQKLCQSLAIHFMISKRACQRIWILRKPQSASSSNRRRKNLWSRCRNGRSRQEELRMMLFSTSRLTNWTLKLAPSVQYTSSSTWITFRLSIWAKMSSWIEMIAWDWFIVSQTLKNGYSSKVRMICRNTMPLSAMQGDLHRERRFSSVILSGHTSEKCTTWRHCSATSAASMMVYFCYPQS